MPINDEDEARTPFRTTKSKIDRGYKKIIGGGAAGAHEETQEKENRCRKRDSINSSNNNNKVDVVSPQLRSRALEWRSGSLLLGPRALKDPKRVFDSTYIYHVGSSSNESGVVEVIVSLPVKNREKVRLGVHRVHVHVTTQMRKKSFFN